MTITTLDNPVAAPFEGVFAPRGLRAVGDRTPIDRMNLKEHR
jgi:hypothetical protein